MYSYNKVSYRKDNVFSNCHRLPKIFAMHLLKKSLHLSGPMHLKAELLMGGLYFKN